MEFLRDWGTTIGAFIAVVGLILLVALLVLNYVLLQQVHEVIVSSHRATLAVIQDELLRQTKGQLVIKAACIILKVVHQPMHGCPPIHLHLHK